MGLGQGSYERQVVTSFYGWHCRRICLWPLLSAILLGIVIAVVSHAGTAGGVGPAANQLLAPARQALLPSSALAPALPEVQRPPSPSPGQPQTGCEMPCSFEGHLATCGNQIRYAAARYYARKARSCGLARSTIDVQCPHCIAACPDGADGCVEPTQRAAEQGDDHRGYKCHVGLAHWAAGWSEGKKVWCCEHYQLGCTSTTAIPL